MTFTITALTGDRVLVSGTDSLGTDGKVVLDASEWNRVKAHKDFHAASEEFDTAVEEFFAPIFEAQAKLEAASKKPEADELSYVVLAEGVEAVRAQQAEVIKLENHDSLVLRVLDSGNHDRLIWVNERLEITA